MAGRPGGRSGRRAPGHRGRPRRGGGSGPGWHSGTSYGSACHRSLWGSRPHSGLRRPLGGSGRPPSQGHRSRRSDSCRRSCSSSRRCPEDKLQGGQRSLGSSARKRTQHSETPPEIQTPSWGSSLQFRSNFPEQHPTALVPRDPAHMYGRHHSSILHPLPLNSNRCTFSTSTFSHYGL